tara:strand:+ start:308 stop:583 length:276 start_codon:yes stop_codon:yes gene_type:complete
MAYLEKLYAIVEVDHGHDGRANPVEVIKVIFDDESEAMRACFEPYKVVILEVDTKQVLIDLSKKLTPVQKYAISCYNEMGITDYLINGKED